MYHLATINNYDPAYPPTPCEFATALLQGFNFDVLRARGRGPQPEVLFFIPGSRSMGRPQKISLLGLTVEGGYGHAVYDEIIKHIPAPRKVNSAGTEITLETLQEENRQNFFEHVKCLVLPQDLQEKAEGKASAYALIEKTLRNDGVVVAAITPTHQFIGDSGLWDGPETYKLITASRHEPLPVSTQRQDIGIPKDRPVVSARGKGSGKRGRSQTQIDESKLAEVFSKARIIKGSDLNSVL